MRHDVATQKRPVLTKLVAKALLWSEDIAQTMIYRSSFSCGFSESTTYTLERILP